MRRTVIGPLTALVVALLFAAPVAAARPASGGVPDPVFPAAGTPGYGTSAWDQPDAYGVAIPGTDFPLRGSAPLAAELADLRSRVGAAGTCWVRTDVTLVLRSAIRAAAWLGRPASCGVGLRVLGIIDQQTLWDAPRLCRGWSAGGLTRARWQALVACVSRTFAGRIDAYEIWNEPQQNHLGYQTGDPAHYARMLLDASAAIRRNDPGARVVGLGGAAAETAAGRRFASRVLAALRDLGRGPGVVDAVSLHAYDPDDCGDPAPSTCGIIRAVRGAWGRPVWITEAGLSSPADQDGWIRLAYPMFVEARAARVFWFALEDTAEGPFGLADPAYLHDTIQARKSGVLHVCTRPPIAASITLSTLGEEPQQHPDTWSLDHLRVSPGTYRVSATYAGADGYLVPGPFEVTVRPGHKTFVELHASDGTVRGPFTVRETDPEPAGGQPCSPA